MTHKVPTPGRPVRGSKTGKPIMVLFDLLGRSWALGIIWHLAEAPMTFRQLQTSCEGVSPTVLNTRLKELRASDLVQHQQDGYRLTASGRELFTLLEPLGGWSGNWAKQLLSGNEGKSSNN